MTNAYLRSATNAPTASAIAKSSNIDGERVGILASTVTDALEELFAGFGSEVAALMVAVFVTVVPPWAPLCSVSLKAAVAPFTNVPIVQVMVPVPFGAGVEQLNAGPLVCVSEANVVFAGIASVSDTVSASVGPLFATEIV